MILRFSLIIIVFLAACDFNPPKEEETSKPKNEVKKEIEKKNYSLLEKRINYLQRIISEPLNGDSRIENLAETNSEWILFTYAFTTYACYNLVKKDSISKENGLRLMRLCLDKAKSEEIANSYSTDLKDLTKPFSVLYIGHLNLMLGLYNDLNDSIDKPMVELEGLISNNLSYKFKESEFGFLESYPGSIWVSDNAVAMLSLFVNGINNINRTPPYWTKWKDNIRSNYTHSKTRLPYSTVDPVTGKFIEEPRGSMLGWIIMFVSQYDPDWGKELYENYKKYFSTDLMGYRLFKERYNDSKTSMGDIDSGPVFMGVSIPANQFALVCSNIHGDTITSKKLYKLVNAGTREIISDSEFKYKTKFIDFEISPLAESLMLFAISME